MANAVSDWEDLRKQARQLESEIDLKLVSFSKLGTGYISSREGKDENSDTVPLLSSHGSGQMFETMSLEIEQLLSKLSDINDKLASYSQMVGLGGLSASALQKLERHKEILQDFTLEFQKTRKNIQARRDREELLGSVRREISAYKSSSGLNRRTELYLKEHDHLRNSERLVDEQISIAVRTKDDLMSQRNTLKAIQTKMTTLANRFPLINSLVQRINIRKRRDSIILGTVIGVCLTIIILYSLPS